MNYVQYTLRPEIDPFTLTQSETDFIEQNETDIIEQNDAGLITSSAVMQFQQQLCKSRDSFSE